MMTTKPTIIFYLMQTLISYWPITKWFFSLDFPIRKWATESSGCITLHCIPSSMVLTIAIGSLGFHFNVAQELIKTTS